MPMWIWRLLLVQRRIAQNYRHQNIRSTYKIDVRMKEFERLEINEDKNFRKIEINGR